MGLWTKDGKDDGSLVPTPNSFLVFLCCVNTYVIFFAFSVTYTYLWIIQIWIIIIL